MCNKEKMRELISAYIDNEATSQERLEAESHLKECADCARYYRELKGLSVVMAKLGSEELSPDSQQKIRNDFLGGRIKREAVMKKKILVSASSVLVIMLLVFPLITMRTYSEEKRSGTIELLLTSPLTDLEIILGKSSAPWRFTRPCSRSR